MPKRKPKSPRRPRHGGKRRAAKELAGLFRQLLHHVTVIEEETEWIRKIVEASSKSKVQSRKSDVDLPTEPRP
jgi:hypothetical protein